MASTVPITLHALAAEAVDGFGASAVDLGVRTALELSLNITAVSGTDPAIDVTVESSPDGSTAWRTVDAFEHENEAGLYKATFAGCDRYVRARWAIQGTTPSFTFAISGIAVLVYATPDDLRLYGLPAAALENVPVSDQHRQLRASTDRYDQALRAAGNVLPLSSWDDSIRRGVCALAAYDILTTRGVDPNTIDTWILSRYTELVGEPGRSGELDRIANGQRVPDIVDSTPTENEGGAYIVTDASRGW